MNSEFPRDSKGRFIKGIPYRKGVTYSLEHNKMISEKTKLAMQNPLVRKKLIEGRRGKPSPMKGKKHSLEARKKISEASISRNYKGENHPNWKGGKPICEDCGKKLSNRKAKFCQKHAYIEKRNYKWNGGIYKPLVRWIRNCYKYHKWKNKILIRDNFKCQFCKSNKKIHVDHYPIPLKDLIKKYNIKNGEQTWDYKEFWDINNGRVLCWDCHKKTKTYGNKKIR